MQIEFDENQHIYKVDGKEYPSVTTVLKYITAEHYGNINPSILERARLRGTATHEALEMFDLCGECEVETEIEGYCKAYLEFLNDYRPKWYGIEKKIFCEEYGFCGTIDRHGDIGGKPCVLDIKTTSSPSKEAYISVCCQTKAYAYALGIPMAKRYALYLKSDGTYRVVDCDEYESKHKFDSWNIFMMCMSLFTMLKGVK